MPEFRETRDRSFQEHREKEGEASHLGVNLHTFLNWKISNPKTGDTWGNWRYNAKLLTLTHVPQNYEVRLDECSTSAETLDWIFQLSSKTWMTDKDVADLIHALEDIINPQANLCSFGSDKKLDVKKYLARSRSV